MHSIFGNGFNDCLMFDQILYNLCVLNLKENLLLIKNSFESTYMQLYTGNHNRAKTGHHGEILWELCSNNITLSKIKDITGLNCNRMLIFMGSALAEFEIF